MCFRPDSGQNVFQSTPPRGRRRPGALQTHKPSPNFNPRLREGGDPNCRTSTTSAVYFNPRLREGGDPPGILLGNSFPDFNPRLREGGDPLRRPLLRKVLLFQSTPPRGRRRKDGWYLCRGNNFNPRLREGGDCINYQFLHLIQSIPCIDHPSGTSN